MSYYFVMLESMKRKINNYILHYVFIQTIYQIYFFVLCYVFERPNVFIWSELQKLLSSLSAPPNEKLRTSKNQFNKKKLL